MKRIPILLAIAAVAVSTTATAAPAPAPLSIAVEVGDLDLASGKGQRILALRLQRAASALCKTEAVASLPRNLRGERACIRAARAGGKAIAKAPIAAGTADSDGPSSDTGQNSRS